MVNQLLSSSSIMSRQALAMRSATLTSSTQCFFAYCGTYLAFSFCLFFFFFPQIFYRVVADIEPGEELLLFMKSEDYSHETMAPDIHG